MFLAASNRKLVKSCLNYGGFFCCAIISILYNWKCRSKAINIMVRQHSQGPGFFLSFSSAIFRLSLACPLRIEHSCYSNTSFAHTAISQGRKRSRFSFIIYQEGKSFPEVLHPKADFLSCLIGQICVICPLLN